MLPSPRVLCPFTSSTSVVLPDAVILYSMASRVRERMGSMPGGIDDARGTDADAGEYPYSFFRGLAVAVVASAPLWVAVIRVVR
jgi:hypothetical protein